VLIPSLRRARRGWPERLPDAPGELVSLIEDAMIDFGPDGHCDGADYIAALVMQWVRENADFQKSDEN